MKKARIAVVALAVLMLFAAVSCKDEPVHQHVFDQKVAEEKYLAEKATEESPAKYYLSCECGEKGEETFEHGEKLDHKYGDWTVEDATCTEKGSKTRKCTHEGCDKIETVEIPALGHDFGDWKVDTEAECTTDGVKSHSCKREGCDAKETETIKAIGHKLDADSKCENCHEEINAAKIGDKEYKTLVEAINAAKDGEIVTLLWDASGAGLFSADSNNDINLLRKRGSIVIDFNGNTYTMTYLAVGSTGTETQAMHWGDTLASVEMKNGTFKVAENTAEVKMAMQNYVKFTAKDMVFDFSSVQVVCYGDTEFSGTKFEQFNGLEVAMFNNNAEESMVLERCKLVMPEDSNKGISPNEGGITLKNTIVAGNANLLDENCKLTLVGESSVNGVVPYFKDSGTIEKTTNDDGSVTYKLVPPTAEV